MAITSSAETTSTRRLGATAVAGLRRVLAGEAVGPADDGYDVHRRVWNGSIDRHPALIARCPAWRTSARPSASPASTGCRSPSGAAATASPGCRTCDGGLVIDLRP